ncbi:MAG TPA: D-aminoacyl-tRNA deacylase, partial [bacterium]|nr:D-aminoacyl-tRNA deacylase [bacterium]
QFTLFGDCRKGRRPSFVGAAEPGRAEELYQELVGEIQRKGVPVKTGQFKAMMDVALINNGPVTLLIDSKKVF